MSTKAWANSPEVDELRCVPETQQSQQAAVVEVFVVGAEGPLKMSDKEHSRIRIQVMRTLLTHRTHRLLRGHRRARAKARASQGPVKGNMYQMRRIREEARNPLFCSLLRRNKK